MNEWMDELVWVGWLWEGGLGWSGWVGCLWGVLCRWCGWVGGLELDWRVDGWLIEWTICWVDCESE